VSKLHQFKNKTYLNRDVTLELAQKDFKKNAVDNEPQEIAMRAGVKYLEKESEFLVPCLNKEYHVRFPSGEIYCNDDEEIQFDKQILILHYLNSAEGVTLTDQLISFKELPSGQIYINPFHGRAILPLIKFFGEQPEKLITAGLALGGEKADKGDVSVIINLFPRVPFLYVIWLGDDEFPASGNILFDASAPNYLPTEDYAVAGGMIVFELKKLADQM
jgi:hypothetical protein